MFAGLNSAVETLRATEYQALAPTRT